MIDLILVILAIFIIIWIPTLIWMRYPEAIKRIINKPKCMDCKWYNDHGFRGELASNGLYHEYGKCTNPKTRWKFSNTQREEDGLFSALLLGRTCTKYGIFFERKE